MKDQTVETTSNYIIILFSDWFMAVQAFAVLGLIFILFAVMCAAAKLFLFTKEKPFLAAATGAAFFGGISKTYALSVKYI